ncbi:hypothetical protein HDU81_000252 [Chytriomyces hyalinus]|nr:hypothetical protein HDU81_000252 [Chytriomyces hyalinus]
MNSAPQTSSDSAMKPNQQLADSQTASARLAGIALKVMTTLLESKSNQSIHANQSILSNNANNKDNNNSQQLRRLIGVFVSCSAKTPDHHRAKGLPTTVLVALLFVSRIVRKAVSLSTRVDEAVVLDKERVNAGCRIPLAIEALLRDPARLFLAGLMLAEASVSDAQTSTASWARLLNGGKEPATSECRKSIAQMKWAVLEFLDHKVIISTNNFVQWCAIVRKWVGDGLVDPMSNNTIPSTSAAPASTPPQHQQQHQQLVTPDNTPPAPATQHSSVLSAFANAVASIRNVSVASSCLSMTLGAAGNNPVLAPPLSTSLGVFSSASPAGVQENLQRHPGSCQPRSAAASCGRSESSVRFGQRVHPYQRTVAL